MEKTNFLRNRLIAHRGIYDNKRIYENTLMAFMRALKYNYPIELDLRMLRDGTIICFHDETMERMLHVEGKIEKLTYEELSFMAKFQIPTIEDVLSTIHGSVPLIIEIISVTRKHALESKLAALLENYQGEFAIQSFNIKTLKWFYKNYSHYPIGYIIGKRNYKKETIFKKYDFLNIKIGLYNDKRIRKIKEDKLVLGWGITNKEEYLYYKEVFDSLVVDNLLDIMQDK